VNPTCSHEKAVIDDTLTQCAHHFDSFIGAPSDANIILIQAVIEQSTVSAIQRVCAQSLKKETERTERARTCEVTEASWSGCSECIHLDWAFALAWVTPCRPSDLDAVSADVFCLFGYCFTPTDTETY
jgi:hypothetical protein